ncbi:hypothetical protein FA09DRAFT_320397 [Tilletiopsis washingtonensis]|uniref:Ubiquitin-like domain-containing protein n=1 Tax=Tilletiopsis washingtonensis TaxID=58919 RepID=A0A316Z5N8_9BASI|nr:hypothetical protein FA09DRAFT_320397 [Tilletiopsis washingtonensis]PWN96871.1 hypothetical protein FA09DRAFT_320397 [Tilletiopsis washingtonensis]
MPFTVTVASRVARKNKATSSAYPMVIELASGSASLAELKRAIHKRHVGLTPERQRITSDDKKPLLDDDKALQQQGVKDGDTLYVKDLGPQVAWRTVFLTEYAGPLVINPLMFWLAPRIWGQFEHSRMQKLALALVVLHYLKREVETVFVHRFSNGTMPLFNIFKNSTHYWILSGVLLSGAINIPSLSASALKGTVQDSDAFLIGCTAVWALAEAGNAWAHIKLRNLRPPGTRERNIPRGGLFDFVSCANYFYEFLAWTAYTALTLSPASALFAAVSTGQMAIWALGKHKKYRKEFKDYPRGRKAMFPFIF